MGKGDSLLSELRLVGNGTLKGHGTTRTAWSTVALAAFPHKLACTVSSHELSRAARHPRTCCRKAVQRHRHCANGRRHKWREFEQHNDVL